MTLDKVQHTGKAHSTGDGACRCAGVKHGDQVVLSPPVDLEDGGKVTDSGDPNGQSCVLIAPWISPRGAISIHQSGHMIYGNLRHLTLARCEGD